MIRARLTALALFGLAFRAFKSIIDIVDQVHAFDGLVVLILHLFVLVALFEVENLFALEASNKVLVF